MNTTKIRLVCIIATLSISVQLNAAQLYVVNGNAGAAEPYDTKDNAAATIQSAIDYASDGDEIIVAASSSVYAPFTISKAVTVRGETGNFNDVVVGGAANNANTITITSSGAVLSGITSSGGLRCIYNSGGGTIQNCRAYNGNPGVTQDESGHGIYNNNGKVIDTVIDGCRSTDHFAGVGYYQTGASALGERLVITNNFSNQIHSNWSSDSGSYGAHGAAIVGGILRNSLIAKNYTKKLAVISAGKYVAIAIFAKDARIINCTIVDNTAPTSSAYVKGVMARGTATFENCLITGNNTGTTLSDWYGNALAFTNCATTSITELPEGNIDSSGYEFLYDASTPVLNFLSPLYNAGKAVPDMGDSDFFGNSRIAYNAPDIGYEEVQEQDENIMCLFTTDMVKDFIPFEGTLKASVGGVLDGLVYYWDLDGDGEIDASGSDLSSIDFRFENDGIYNTTLYVTNSTGSGYSYSIELTAVERKTRYVNIANTSPLEPYTTPETAGTNLQQIIDFAQDGDTIIVYPGTYDPITVTKYLGIKGSTGDYRDVIIDGKVKSRCIQLSNARASISSMTIKNGHVGVRADQQGIGIRMSNGGIVTNCYVTSCNRKGGVASEWVIGGGIYNVGGYVVDCVIDNCYAYNHQGGIGYAQTGDNAIGERLVITNNTANLSYGNGTQTGGAGAWVGGGILRNSIIARNGAGTWAHASPPLATGVRIVKGLLINCTIYGNYITDNKTAAYAGVVNEANGYVKNCIIYENGSRANSTVANWLGVADNFINCATFPIKGLPEGNIDITTTDWTFSSQKGSLQASSHLVDAGIADENYGTLDVFSQPRIDNDKVDIGHEEYQTGELSVPFTSASGYLATDIMNTTLTAAPRGENTDGLVYYWDFDGDGVADIIGADKNEVQLEISSPGIHNVYLSVTNSAGYGTTSMHKIYIQAKHQYVDSNSTNPTYPYGSPETASTDLQTAINAAVDGGTITILNGSRLNIPGPIIVSKAITIKGETGNFNDVIVKANSLHSIFDITNPDATISSITISGGGDVNGAAGVYIVDGGVVTNCRVTGMTQSSGKGVGIYNNNGQVLDCVIDGIKMHDNANENASAYIYYGLALYQSGDNALTDRCIITNNYSPVIYAGARRGAMAYIDGGSLRNSYIADNNAGKVQGRTVSELASGVLAAGNSFVDNCTIERNVTQGSGIWTTPGLRLVGNAVARNCIAVNNGDGAAEINDWMGTASSFMNILTTSSIEGISGGIKAEGEVFVLDARSAIPTLPLDSPAVGAGAILGWMTGSSLDLNKKSRFVNSSTSIGCLEAGTSAIAISYTADVQNGLDSFTATLTPTIAGSSSSQPFTIEWDFGDGQEPLVVSTLDPVTHTFSYPEVPYGEKAVTATIKVNDTITDSFSRKFILAPTRVYAANGNANAQYPYATPETAAPNIQTAIDAAYDGSEVIILASANKYYYNNASATIKVYRNITLRGETGDFNDVVIDVNRRCRAMLITARNAVVRDITISNGTGGNNIQSSGGAGVRMQGGELRNCRITSCYSSDGVFATGVWCDNGKIIDCVFDHNYNGGGHMCGLGVQAMGKSALVDRCVFTNNNSSGFYSWSQFRVGVITALDATIRNCFVAHNNLGYASAVSTAYTAVGIHAEGAIIENCTVVSNRFTSQASEFVNASGGVCGHNGAIFINNVVEDNYSPSGLNNYRFDSTVSITNCATTPIDTLTGSGLITAAEGDYIAVPGKPLVVPSTSTLIGKGYNMPWMETAFDLIGNKRRVRKNVDIGCLEDQNRPATIFLVQ